MPLTPPEKAREHRLRRMAQRQDKVLSRSKTRDPHATNYGLYSVSGQPVGNLDDVEALLTARS